MTLCTIVFIQWTCVDPTYPWLSSGILARMIILIDICVLVCCMPSSTNIRFGNIVIRIVAPTSCSKLSIVIMYSVLYIGSTDNLSGCLISTRNARARIPIGTRASCECNYW